MTALLPHFVHHRPETLPRLLDLLAEHGERARILAGGTDLLERMRAGIVHAEHVISLGRVPGLDHVRFDEGMGLTIGARASLADVGRHPAVRQFYPTLSRACTVMCTPQICNMATVVGNLVNGSPSADAAPPLLIHDARLALVSTAGEREISLADFFLGPGRVERRPEELVREARVPAPAPEAGSSFQRISARSAVDIAAVLAAALLEIGEDGRIRSARVALGAVAPTPRRCLVAEELLAGGEPDPALFEEAAGLCAAVARPIDDTRASAAWRRAMVGVLSRRALEEAAQVARGGVR
ncbi:MAG: xanthine dehydrogenase family protein subunit M [Planctomycetota bacterium]